MDQNQNTVSQEGFPTLEAEPEQLELFSLQDMAIKGNQGIERLREELKNAREMLEQAEDTDEIVNTKNKITDLQKNLKAMKLRYKTPEIISLSEKIKAIQHDIKDRKQTITMSALELYRRSGTTEFEREGVTYQIVTVAKLKKVQQ